MGPTKIFCTIAKNHTCFLKIKKRKAEKTTQNGEGPKKKPLIKTKLNTSNPSNIKKGEQNI